MALPDVEWRYVGRRVMGTGTISVATIMDNIYALATGTTYADGTTRITGVNSAGVWERYQTGGGVTEAIYVTPPSGSQKIIIAGSTGTGLTPDMCTEIGTNSSYSSNKLFVNIVKNPGSFSTWNNSTNPFSSGNSMGYVPFLGSRSVATTGITSYAGMLHAYLFESKESIGVFIIETNTTATSSYSNGFFAGALIDPQSAHPYDAESDGRLYGIFTTGHYTTSASTNDWPDAGSAEEIWNTAWHSRLTTGSFLYGYSTNVSYCSARGGIFEPGTGNVKPVILGNSITSTAGATTPRSLLTNSGKYVRAPMIIKGALSVDPIVYGTLRNMSFCKDGLITQQHMNGSNIIGYVVSCCNNGNTAGTADAILLEY